MINIIVAMSKNRVIGNNNSLIWNIPTDLKRFKKLTTGNIIIMGRKTHESIGRVLPNRRNIIITRDPNYKSEGCEIYTSIKEAVLKFDSEDEVFIIGGGEIYEQTIDIADRLFITLIDREYVGDTYFPEIPNKYVQCFKQDIIHDGVCVSFIDYTSL